MAMFFRVLALTCLLLAGRNAQAQVPSGWSPSLLVKGGTLGFGPELDVRVPSTRFGVRVGIDGLGFHDSDMIDGTLSHSEPAYAYDARLRYSGTVRLLNGGVTGDWYPFGGGLRLSAGLLLNGNEVHAHAQPVGVLRLGTMTLAGPAPALVDARATFNLVAPVLGLGYSVLVFGRMRVSLDVGAMYQGNPHLSYSMSGSLTQLPSVAGDAERERRRIQQEVNYPVYPVAMLGVGWQF
ncbi:MAG: hypothetical protein ACRYHQ_36080 [Janthinobacterium lividum]